MNPLNANSAQSVIAAFITLTTALGISMAASSISEPAQARENISGNWYDDTGRGAVELYRCGTGMCGRIIWLRNPVSQAGTPLRDKYNPSPSDRRRPICGLQVIDQIKPQTDGSWDSGRIYDPKVGKTYDVAIERLSSNRLRITGYLGMRLFGKSFIWRRAPNNLPKCTASQ